MKALSTQALSYAGAEPSIVWVIPGSIVSVIRVVIVWSIVIWAVKPPWGARWIAVIITPPLHFWVAIAIKIGVTWGWIGVAIYESVIVWVTRWRWWGIAIIVHTLELFETSVAIVEFSSTHVFHLLESVPFATF